MSDAATLAESFKALHSRATGFIMPNAWDPSSALILAEAGFEAIGTTSAGIAFSRGKQDYAVADGRLAVPRAEMFDRMREIADAVAIPVNADLEAGFGDGPEAVAETVRMAIEAGLAGGNIEDKQPQAPALYDESLAVERIRAAREAIDTAKSAFVLTARSDAIVWSHNGIDDAIRRSNLYRAAGADCLFTPGATDLPRITLLAREIDGPLNMVLGLGDADGNARAWIAAGVRRVSLGGTIARAALGFVRRAAEELRDHGTIAFARDQMSHPELNALFAQGRRT